MVDKETSLAMKRIIESMIKSISGNSTIQRWMYKGADDDFNILMPNLPSDYSYKMYCRKQSIARALNNWIVDNIDTEAIYNEFIAYYNKYDLKNTIE